MLARIAGSGRGNQTTWSFDRLSNPRGNFVSMSVANHKVSSILTSAMLSNLDLAKVIFCSCPKGRVKKSERVRNQSFAKEF